MARFSHPLLKSATGLVLALLLSACGSPVTQDNFAKIKTGMSQEDVEAILGSPDESSNATIGNFSGASASWKSSDATITVQFVNDEVQFKQFIKGEAD